jgi:hypothetical protein
MAPNAAFGRVATPPLFVVAVPTDEPLSWNATVLPPRFAPFAVRVAFRPTVPPAVPDAGSTDREVGILLTISWFVLEEIS